MKQRHGNTTVRSEIITAMLLCSSNLEIHYID